MTALKPPASPGDPLEGGAGPEPEWVVEVNEVLLNSTGAQPKGPMEWWSVNRGLPGFRARTIYLAIVPPGALLYVRCDDQEEAEWMHDFLIEKGLHRKGVAVRRVGQVVKCAGCGQRRPFWATAKGIGRRCRPCWDEATRLGHPGGGCSAVEGSP